MEIGDRFIRQVYVLTSCLIAIVTTGLLILKPLALPSFLIGSTISLSFFWSIEFVVRRLVRPGKTKRTKYLLGFIALGKYTLLGALLYVLFKMEWMDIYAFASGIASVQVAFIIKAVHLMVIVLSNKDPDQS